MAKATNEHKPVQPGCKQAVFSAAEWARWREAFARAKAALGSGELAARDLIEHLRKGRLDSLVRRVAQDGSETFVPLKPSDWEGAVFSRSGKIRPSDSMARMAVDDSGVPTRSPPTPQRVLWVSPPMLQRESWVPPRNWFSQAGGQDVADQPPRARLWPFVARADLDRLYPIVTNAPAKAIETGLIPAPERKIKQKPKKEAGRTPKRRIGPAEAYVRQMLRELYPPLGRVPRDVSTTTVHKNVEIESGKRGKKPPPSYETVRRALNRRRRG
jgi:hypothetical protein